MAVSLVALSGKSSSRLPSAHASDTREAGKSGRNCGKVFRFSGQSCQIRPDGGDVAAFLRSVYPVKTAASVEAAEGISADTYRKWESAGCAPSHATTLRLILRHGPEFLAALVPEGERPDWLEGALKSQRQARLEAEIAERRKALEHLSAATAP